MLAECQRVLKAVADPTRARVLKLLEREGELCVCQIVAVLGAAQSTVSQQLGILRDAGLIEGRRRGRWAFYRLSDGLDSHRALVLELVCGWVENDHTIARDWQRCREVLAVPYGDLCRDGVPVQPARENLEGSDSE